MFFIVVALYTPDMIDRHIAVYDKSTRKWRWLREPLPESQIQVLGDTLVYQEKLQNDFQTNESEEDVLGKRRFVIERLGGETVASWSATADTELLLLQGDSLVFRRGSALYEATIREKTLTNERVICEHQSIENVHWAAWWSLEKD